MQPHAERFGISDEEAKFVSSLAHGYSGDEEGEYDACISKCETEGGKLYFRTLLAVYDFVAFLKADADEGIEALKTELLSLGRYQEILETPACHDIICELMAIDTLAHINVGHQAAEGLVDKEFADKQLLGLLRSGKLGEPKLSRMVLDLLAIK